MPRLGRAVERTGQAGAEMVATLAADVRRLADRARSEMAAVLLLGATEAVRRARDRDAVLDAVSAAAGTRCTLISPATEARLSYRGAVSARPDGGVLVVADIGGGSTECVLGRGRDVLALASVGVGSGVVTDRWLTSDPPTDAERSACAEGVREALRDAPDGSPDGALITGGTATTVPLLLGRGADADLDTDDVDRCRDILARTPSAEVARRHDVPADRARVLAGGVEIIAAVMSRYRLRRITTTHRGLRHGMVLAFLERGDAWAEA